MRILFIKSTLNSSSARADFGIASLSAMLKKHGHTVDLFVVRSLDTIPVLEYRIALTKPDIIAFSVYASLFQGIVRISNRLKKRFPNILQVMGGVHVVLNPQDILKAPSIDAVCTGEGEYAFVEFIKRYKRKDGSHLKTDGFWTRQGRVIRKNPNIPFVRDMDALPFPDRELFLRQEMSYGGFYSNGKMYLDFLFTRGCPFPCPYCSNHALRKIYGAERYVRRMSPRHAIDWVKHDLARYACDRVCIIDDTFTLDTKWTEEFLALYKKEVPVPFTCLLRVGTFTASMVKKLKQAGCVRVTIGVESGDEQYRKDILKRPMTDRELLEAFGWVKDAGISAGAFVMIGLPGETPRMWLKTIRLLGKLKPNKIVLNIYYAYPGTVLHALADSMGFLPHGKQRADYIEGIEPYLRMPQFGWNDIRYYTDHLTDMVLLSASTAGGISGLYKKVLFFLLSIPPRSKWFPIIHAPTRIYDKASRMFHSEKDVRLRME